MKDAIIVLIGVFVPISLPLGATVLVAAGTKVGVGGGDGVCVSRSFFTPSSSAFFFFPPATTPPCIGEVLTERDAPPRLTETTVGEVQVEASL